MCMNEEERKERRRLRRREQAARYRARYPEKHAEARRRYKEKAKASGKLKAEKAAYYERHRETILAKASEKRIAKGIIPRGTKPRKVQGYDRERYREYVKNTDAGMATVIRKRYKYRYGISLSDTVISAMVELTKLQRYVKEETK